MLPCPTTIKDMCRGIIRLEYYGSDALGAETRYFKSVTEQKYINFIGNAREANAIRNLKLT